MFRLGPFEKGHHVLACSSPYHRLMQKRVQVGLQLARARLKPQLEPGWKLGADPGLVVRFDGPMELQELLQHTQDDPAASRLGILDIKHVQMLIFQFPDGDRDDLEMRALFHRTFDVFHHFWLQLTNDGRGFILQPIYNFKQR